MGRCLEGFPRLGGSWESSGLLWDIPGSIYSSQRLPERPSGVGLDVYGGHFWRLDANLETLKKRCILLYFLALKLIRDPCAAPGGASESPMGRSWRSAWRSGGLLHISKGSLEGSGVTLGAPRACPERLRMPLEGPWVRFGRALGLRFGVPGTAF